MKGALWNVCKYVFIIPFEAGVHSDERSPCQLLLSRAVMEADLGVKVSVL